MTGIKGPLIFLIFYLNFVFWFLFLECQKRDCRQILDQPLLTNIFNSRQKFFEFMVIVVLNILFCTFWIWVVKQQFDNWAHL